MYCKVSVSVSDGVCEVCQCKIGVNVSDVCQCSDASAVLSNTEACEFIKINDLPASQHALFF